MTTDLGPAEACLSHRATYPLRSVPPVADVGLRLARHGRRPPSCCRSRGRPRGPATCSPSEDDRSHVSPRRITPRWAIGLQLHGHSSRAPIRESPSWEAGSVRLTLSPARLTFSALPMDRSADHLRWTAADRRGAHARDPRTERARDFSKGSEASFCRAPPHGTREFSALWHAITCHKRVPQGTFQFITVNTRNRLTCSFTI